MNIVETVLHIELNNVFNQVFIEMYIQEKTVEYMCVWRSKG